MSLNQNKIQNFKNKNNIFKRNSFDSKISLKLNTNNKPSNQSKISDITYKLFSNQYKNIKDGIKIKKIEAKYKSNEKHRCKTIKNKNNHSNNSIHSKNTKYSKKDRINSALIENNKINRVNSIIININNSQFNKTNIKNNNSFRNITNSQMNEQYFSSSTNTKPHKNDYFYDFSTNKKQSNDKNNYFNSYNTNTNMNTYNIKSKNYNFHKIDPKPNNKIKIRTNEQIDFKIYKKNPIKIKTNAISKKLKNKMYIIKKHNSDKTFNISFNNKSNNNINKLHKFLSSKNLNNTYKESNVNIINNNMNFVQKSAEKNYLEKWQFYIGENIIKKRSLSQMNSNKNYNSIFQKNTENKNKVLSQREDKNMKSLYYLNSTKNSIIHYDINNNNDKENDIGNSDGYNYTENNQEYNNKIVDDFLLETIQKDKIKKQYETEKKMLNQNINDNKALNANSNNFHKNYYIDKEKNLENYKIKEYDSINKIIERKKREIDLLNVMKFTSEIYFNNNNNNNNNNGNENKVNNKNMNFFNNKDIFYENNKYHVINSNDTSEKILYFKDNNGIYNVNSIDNNGFLLDKNNNINTNNNTNDDLTSIININTSHNDNI